MMLTALWAQERPNILILLADDLGYSDLSCYGSQHINTPNLDQLAADGMRFTDFYAPAPNCSPSRTGLMTGRIPSRVGMYSYISPDGPMFLSEQEITLANITKYAGYQTAHVGKWHLNYGLENAGLPQPVDHGFEYSLGTQNNAAPSHLNPNNFVLNGDPVGVIQGYSCQIVADTTIAWLSRRDTSKPFFVCDWFHEPHTPIASPPELVARHSDVGNNAANYYANIENLDSAIGRILDALDDMGLRENTLVIFSSDNGSVRQESNQPLRGVKSNTWDGGIREPGLFRWPGKIEAGIEMAEPAGLVDVLPTLCALTGVPVPPDRKIDGTNILPLLLNTGNLEEERPLFWFFYRVNPAAALRIGDYTLVGRLEAGLPSSHSLSAEQMTWLKTAELVDFELYNLRDDIGEQNDLAQQEPALFESMKAKMLEMHQDILADGPQWFVQGEPVWDAGKEPAMLSAGCMDSAYAEYDADANVMDIDACQTLKTMTENTGDRRFSVAFSNRRKELVFRFPETIQGNITVYLCSMNGELRTMWHNVKEGTGYKPAGIVETGIHMIKAVTPEGVLIGRVLLMR
jgi:arylsulfatase A